MIYKLLKKRTDIIKKYLCVFIAIIMLTQCDKSEVDEMTAQNGSDIFTELETTYDVTIHYEYSESFFPNSWLEPPISGYGIQIEYSEEERMEAIISNCLSRYSKPFIASNLTDIYLLKRLYLYDRGYGATSSESGVYITNDGYDYNYLLARLHSEFSSILYRNYSSLFPTEEWNAINDSDFEYVGSGVDMLGEDNLYGQSEELLSNGFLVNYSRSSMENDFNMFVDWTFTKPDELQELKENYDKISEKYNLVIQYYDQIDSGVEF